MKINYLFSGIDKEKGFYDVQSKYLKQDIKENQIITFIASTFDNHEQNIMYKNKTLEFFSKINITFKENYLIDNNVTKEEAKDFAIYFANCLEYLDASGFIPANQKLESGNPVVKAYQDSGVELMFADPAQADQAASDLTTEIANESGIKFWEGTYIQNAVIAAKKSRADFDKVIEDYNTKWNANKEKLSK